MLAPPSAARHASLTWVALVKILLPRPPPPEFRNTIYHLALGLSISHPGPVHMTAQIASTHFTHYATHPLLLTYRPIRQENHQHLLARPAIHFPLPHSQAQVLGRWLALVSESGVLQHTQPIVLEARKAQKLNCQRCHDSFIVVVDVWRAEVRVGDVSRCCWVREQVEGVVGEVEAAVRMGGVGFTGRGAGSMRGGLWRF